MEPMELSNEDGLLEGPMIVQTGRRSVNLNGSDRHQNVPVTFRKPFNKIPVVFVALTGLISDKDHDIRFVLNVSHVTERGFNFEFEAPVGGSRNASIPALNPITASFMAVGQ